MAFTLLQVVLTLNNHWRDPSKQDSGSNRADQKYFIILLKSNKEKQNYFQ